MRLIYQTNATIADLFQLLCTKTKCRMYGEKLFWKKLQLCRNYKFLKIDFEKMRFLAIIALKDVVILL